MTDYPHQPWFSIDLDLSVERHDTAEEARTAAERALDDARDESASDGWPEETTRIAWGVVLGEVTERNRVTIEEAEANGDEDAVETMRRRGFEYTCAHDLVERTALRDVLAEREKQRAKWGDAHDDAHDDEELATAAAWLAIPFENRALEDNAPRWALRISDRTESRREDLVIAAALLLAEIERLDRAAKATAPS